MVLGKSIEIAQRMLLWSVWLPLLDLVLVIYPRSPDDVKQRALLRYSLGQTRSAAEDLEQYLKMSPDASDADEIRQTALSLRRMLALMN